MNEEHPPSSKEDRTSIQLSCSDRFPNGTILCLPSRSKRLVLILSSPRCLPYPGMVCSEVLG